MENKLQIFTNEQFGQLRTVEVDGEIYFVGKDVAIILGYAIPAKAIIDHVDAEDKGTSVLETPGGKQEMTVINESGLYSLILSSKLPKAKEFKRNIGSFTCNQKARSLCDERFCETGNFESGLSGKAMNQLLHQLKIQYPCGGTFALYGKQNTDGAGLKQKDFEI